MNGTDGKRATSESDEIEIRVYRPMSEVSLSVDQDDSTGEIVRLNCEAFGGYPENYDFSYELNGNIINIDDLFRGSLRLKLGDELICLATWSVGDQKKSMQSDTFLSTYQKKPLRNNNQVGGGDFDLYGGSNEFDDSDENDTDFPDRDDGNKTTKMIMA